MTRPALRWLALATLALGVTLPDSLEAQGGRRRIAAGDTKSGRLTTDEWAQLWQLNTRAGTTLTIDLSSTEFDSYLAVRGPGLTAAVTDDDSGPGCDARVTRRFEAAGPYTILVYPAHSSATFGSYTLRVTEGSQDEQSEDECDLGQPDWSRGDLSRLPRIEVGQSARGELADGDSTFRGVSYRLYVLSARPNSPVTIDLTAEFDALLRVRGGDLRATLSDDDDGPGCDARIVHTFTGRGPYVIMVTAFDDAATGPFTLRVREGADSLLGEDDCGGNGAEGDEMDEPGVEGGPPADVSTLPRIAVGQTISGQLTASDSVYSDGSYYQLYAFSPRAGTTLTIDLGSADFDAYLMVRGGDLGSLLRDDDSGPGCDARIVRRFEGAGPYVILVNTVRRRATGAFTLKLSEGTTAAESDDQCGRN